MELEVLPLTPDRWDDLVELFSRPGASIPRYCWCMHPRTTRADFSRKGVENRAGLEATVRRGVVPGLIGYEAGRPVGWVALGPREDYVRFRRSRIAKPVDDQPVWSIVCFFVDSHSRGRGVTEALLAAAVDYARAQGATLIEAYPVDRPERISPISLWWGAKAIYDRAGFEEVARRAPTRPVVRKALAPPREGSAGG